MNNIIKRVLSSIFPIIFLYETIINEPNVLNYIPYSIHQMLGNSNIPEHIFILIFNIMISFLIYILMYRFINSIMKDYEK